MVTPARLEQYMLRAAEHQYESQIVGPFELFFHPNDSLRFYNYARPLAAAGGDLHTDIAALRDAYVERNRLPRFEFVEEFAPELAISIAAEGFALEARQSLMICEKSGFLYPPPPEGVTIERLSPTSPLPLLRTFLTIQDEGFMAGVPVDLHQERLDDLVHSLMGGTSAYVASLDEHPSSVAATTVILDRLTELVGVATIPAQRSKGIGTAVVSAAVAEAFANGAHAVFLVAEDEPAGRMYKRLGFQHRWWALSYSAC